MAEKLRLVSDEVKGIAATLLAVISAISLLSYNEWDPSPFTYTDLPPQNYGGAAGAWFSDVLFSTIGASSYLVPLAFMYYAVRRLSARNRNALNLLGLVMLVVSVSLNSSLFVKTYAVEVFKGGMMGDMISYFLIASVSHTGAFIIGLSAFFSSIVLLTPFTFSSLMMKRNFKDTRVVGDIKIIEDQRTRDKNIDIARLRGDDEKSGARPLASNGVRPTASTGARPHSSMDEGGVKPAARIVPDIVAGRYTLPPLELLSDRKSRTREVTREELLKSAAILHDRLSDFGVTGKILQIHPGPVITMFEFEPSAGVKISKIVALSDDLGRAMGGIKVRVSLIPGKTPIGIEVPNAEKAVVSLKEIIGSEKFTEQNSLLTLSLGKDIYGNPVAENLARMPHLLVAGTTGSGKSVGINSMIMSVLYKARPSEVKMLMIDPKLLELSIYEGIPHLIAPVVTSPKDAAEALKKVVLEMERRYRLIAEQGSRSIEMFNVSVPDDDKLPYIIVIIDELADLMFTASKQVEESIVRLAQMARASGIHLIVATQRPSVDVITGIIKANFPSRIAFQVSSKVDSRTILDTHGAEKLLGQGDMLYLSSGARIQRVHGSYVAEDEINAVVDFIKAQGKPDFSHFESIVIESKDAADGAGGGERAERDEHYREVVEFARTAGEVSISSIQRRFKVGYNRAATIMEMMVEDGFVGPPKGAGKPRDFVDG
jgi:S-DNA-T family DNA segregation ATPase FtsK/SpoIIIE